MSDHDRQLPRLSVHDPTSVHDPKFLIMVRGQNLRISGRQ